MTFTIEICILGSATSGEQRKERGRGEKFRSSRAWRDEVHEVAGCTVREV